MTSKDFVKAVYAEKVNLLDVYFERKPNPYADITPKSEVAELIAKLKLDKEQNAILLKILNGALRDSLYTLLLALDGSASIGDEEQQMFDLKDEDGNKLTGGELEGYAYEYFHGQKE